jgi:5-methylthioadenosine/S-adenosylhomocysteine deaminase
MKTIYALVVRTVVLIVGCTSYSLGQQPSDWSIAGTIFTPNGIITDNAISMSPAVGTITAVEPTISLPNPTSAVRVPGIILPGFIDLHNHLTWNVLPRWIPSRKFNNRYEWQDTAEYDRVLVEPHNAVIATAACEAEIYAEIKAIVGGATSVVGSLLPNKDYPNNGACAVGLARNLDLASGLNFSKPNPSDKCETRAGSYQQLLDVVDYEVFPLELTHPRFDFLLCELGTKGLKGLIIHLSEGASNDSSAHREFTMLDKAGLLQPGLTIIHGTAIRPQDFFDMAKNNVGLIWSPRSNDELYGSTTNIAAALAANVQVAIAPDWSPSGSAGMLQEMSYVARRYPSITSANLVAMATSTPAKIARVDDQIGSLTPGKLADFVVINVKVDPQAPRPLDPVVNATAASVALVVVGGQPIYGDPILMAQVMPGAKFDQMVVCGANKAIYLGQSGAAARNENLAEIVQLLRGALASTGSHLSDIECD